MMLNRKIAGNAKREEARLLRMDTDLGNDDAGNFYREEYRWIDAVIRTALDLGIAPIFWEIGSQHPGSHGMGDINRRYPFEMSETFRRVMEPHL